jgi:1-acyl-sn-glycerol-3-phosphate acyltransferase
LGIRRPWVPFGRWAVRWGCKVVGVRVDVRGLDNVERGKPVVFMPNHVSLLDGPLVATFIPGRLRIIVKKEAFRIPVIGTAMKLVRFIPVDRRGTEAGKAAVARAIAAVKTSGDPFLVFPEGTRSRDGRLQKFRRGGFFLAVESGSAIVPMAVQGTYELMPRGSWAIRAGQARITFLPAVPTTGVRSDDLGGLMERVRASIAGALEKEIV